MAYELKKEIDLIEILTAQGFSEETIRKAFKMTDNRSLEGVVQAISEIQQNETEENKRKEEILTNKQRQERIFQQQREEKLREEKYKQKLLDIIKNDQLEREMIQKVEPNISKSASSVEFGECTIRIRFGDSSKILSFRKLNTVRDLFKKVGEVTGFSSFQIFILRPHTEIILSDKTLEEVGLTPTCMLMVIE